MLSSRHGHFLDKLFAPLISRVKVDPNIITMTGFFLTAAAAFVIPQNLRLGGVLILVGGLFDILDGITARLNNKVTRFGAFLDSVFDRYSDAFIFLSLAWYLGAAGDHTGVFLSLGVLTGALLISYTKARAEALGEACNVGVMERPERVILVSFAVLTGWLVPVLWIMLVLTHITVLQRILHTYKKMEAEKDNNA